jgi:hypothetical protein
MMLYRRIAALAIVGVLAIPVAGCANGFGQKVSNVFTAATTATVDPQAIIIAANTFDGLQATAKNYLRLPRCSAASGPVCRNPAVTPSIITAVHSGRDARKKALAFLKAHPGQLGPQGVYDALQGAVGELQSLFAAYNIGGL